MRKYWCQMGPVRQLGPVVIGKQEGDMLPASLRTKTWYGSSLYHTLPPFQLTRLGMS